MPEQKKEGLSELATMLELYMETEIPDLKQRMTSELPLSCREALSIIAKVSLHFIFLLKHWVFFDIQQEKVSEF